MTLFAQEIKAGLQWYTYTPIDGVEFACGRPLKSFFEQLYENKKCATTDRSFWKLILNSAYGFWGYDSSHGSTSGVCNINDTSEYSDALVGGKLRDLQPVGEEKMLYTITNDTVPHGTNVAIAAAITSYARIILHKWMIAARENGADVYYVDTDSLLLSKPVIPTGDGLGQMKLEGEFVEGEIFGCRAYVLTSGSSGSCTTTDDTTIIGNTTDANGGSATTNNKDKRVLSGFQGVLTDDDIQHLRIGDLTQVRDSTRGKLADEVIRKVSFAPKYTKGTVGVNGVVTPLLL
jgi:hypothetical protein